MGEWRVYVNLFIAAAGAGLLSYPFAVQQTGILLCIGLTLLCAALTVFTDYILLQAACLFREELRSGSDGGGFDSLCLHALGPRQARLASASIVIGSLGAQIGYLIAIGDLLCAPLGSALSCSPTSTSLPCLLVSRAVVVPVVAFSVTLPLTFFSSLMSLGHSSALAALTVLAVAGVVAAQGAAALAQQPLATVGSTAAPPSADPPSALVLARWSVYSTFQALPISVFSLGNHMQVIPLFFSATPALQRAFPRTVLAAVASCVLLYLCTGITGYAAYRTGIKGDVMLNLPSTPATATGKALLAIHLLLSYPVLFFPTRRTLTAAAGQAAVWLGSRGEGAPQQTASPPPPLWPASLCALLAVFAPSISIVFGLLGATVAAYQIYCVPGLLMLKFAAAAEGRGEGGWGRVPALWPVVAGKLEGEGSTVGLLAGPASSGGEEEEEGEGQQAAQQQVPLLRLLPMHSPAALRGLGWMLLAMFVAICAIGTVCYILSTFL